MFSRLKLHYWHRVAITVTIIKAWKRWMGKFNIALENHYILIAAFIKKLTCCFDLERQRFRQHYFKREFLIWAVSASPNSNESFLRCSTTRDENRFGEERASCTRSATRMVSYKISS
jgi:hypothetical protein